MGRAEQLDARIAVLEERLLRFDGRRRLPWQRQEPFYWDRVAPPKPVEISSDSEYPYREQPVPQLPVLDRQR